MGKKIDLDKYYTSVELAEYVVKKAKEVIGEQNILEYLEPSAGQGVFLQFFDKPYLAYDIEPDGEGITQQDFLTLELPYKAHRCIISNVPFGIKNTLAVQFYKKSIQLGDYIAFILPISQYQNNQQMYEFDLLYSEDLGKRMYSNKKVHCCLNIYRRNPRGFNPKPNYKLKDVSIVEVRLNNKAVSGYDMRICAWGASIGKELKYDGQYAKEFCIFIHNKEYKDRILKLLREVKWAELYNMTATPNLLQWQVYKYLKEQISELE